MEIGNLIVYLISWMVVLITRVSHVLTASEQNVLIVQPALLVQHELVCVVLLVTLWIRDDGSVLSLRGPPKINISPPRSFLTFGTIYNYNK